MQAEALWQRRLDFFQNPLFRCFQVAVVAVKTAVEDVLEQAGPLATQHGIVLHRKKVAIGRISGKHLHLWLIIAGGQVVRSLIQSMGPGISKVVDRDKASHFW